ncbi:MAG TPA: DEAD/DEAH box helicase, partial [Desulfobacteraceae bacterium]|nr:DEAD/DEAH box helicase [Desulfobacteraceae bacterium]
MIPSVLAQHVRQGIEDFLRTTFPVSTPFFHGMLDHLLAEEGEVFKGPYLSIQLPFRQGEGGPDFFPDVPLKFRPYLHQEKAFRRLSSPNPSSTIIATGTGSGKTECFLYPILDHCYRHRGEPGIKAILIYPMNALAMDQAGRLARIIYNNLNLRGHITAGLYVGQSEREPAMVMGPDSIITNKETMRLSPPDILLTNYKMLDYLLIRPKDYPLWKQNGPETLQYLVADELHTFDGAQGTDLACLVRRLKARLGTPKRFLCCVGTSATLGSKEEQEDLLKYASLLFGEPFDEDAVITESQLTAGEFLEKSLISRVEIVPPERAGLLDPEYYDDYQSYIRSQHELWFGQRIEKENLKQDQWRVELGKKLKEHLFFQNLLKALGGKVKSYDQVLAELEKVTPELREGSRTYQTHLLDSLLSLVSEARTWAPEGSEKQTAPFLNVRLHLWLRELRRMVAKVSRQPRLRFSDDLNEEQLRTHLPVIHCRECGSMAWAGIKRQNDSSVNPDLQSFYIGFFSSDPKVVFLFPEGPDSGENNKQEALNGIYYHFCSSCLSLTSRKDPKNCPSCGNDELIKVFVPNTRAKRKGRMVGLHHCPFCDAHNSLTILGSRAASLTSVIIAQLYSSSFNDDKKLLAFSDSVQDAAHRAGVFGGRTYRFNFRTALQKCVLAEGDGQTLAELPETFIRYWSNRLDEKAYIATFLAPNMTWLHDYDYLIQHGQLPKGSDLREHVDRRVHWEIFSEYGFNARIGRTLEKTSSSVAYLDPERLQKLLPHLYDSLRNEIGELRDLDVITLKRFLIGFLIHLKNQGAILHPGLETYIKAWGYTGIFLKIPWMPNFSPNARTPMFLTTRAKTRFDRLFSPDPHRRTWYQNWAEKCFLQVNASVGPIIDRIYAMVIRALEKEGIIEERCIKKDRVWGIRPEAFRITTSVRQFKCTRCGHNVSVSDSEKQIWIEAPCLRFHCGGHYEERKVGPDYYRKLYATGDVQRIFAAEHTGLLDREYRQSLEKQFKARGEERNPWDPNLLSCSPTLELGIDIGDLSSVILCSVPPAQANYQQRIGRAGRQNGNALNIAVANARPHDLFFFAEPNEMIAGRVEPPGVFLDASAVLERQLTAFCFDRWVESGIPERALPDLIGKVLNNLEPINKAKFPHNFVQFIENNRTDLLDRFMKMFADTLSAESKRYLKIFMEGDKTQEPRLAYRIMERLYSLQRERESLRKKIRVLNKKIKQRQKDPAKDKNYEKELGDLQREKAALQALVQKISGRNTYNFFTDEGLIPNYAFPEMGVILRSVFHRKKKDPKEGESKYETWTYEYERPAVSAIDELAPANHFYAGGRKVLIDQVNMDVSKIETWRFCNNCSHMELEVEQPEKKVCPHCGSPMWADAGQRRQMLRMRQVFATTSDRDSRIGDENDDREPNFYVKQMLVDFESKHITNAYKIDSDELPFGFEFLSKATFREVNFGEKGEGGENLTIAGVEMPRKGFKICYRCGKIQTSKDEIRHALTCPVRDQDSEKNVVDCIYLYREFSSEAIRILLPLTTFSGPEKKLHSFIAALHLGLKLKYGGNIDHIRTTIYDEPVEDSSYRKKYVVLFDTIPGGTGYLKQLMRDAEQVLEVFEMALNVLKSCSCNKDPSKDGCYRCLFAYRTSYNMEETSRDTAIELLSSILEHKNQLVKTDTLKSIKVNVLFDSELEARFIEALRRMRRENKDITLSKELVNGKPGYFMRIGNRAYYIEPQVTLDANEGVNVPSKADFVFQPARTQEGIKPIAVFTDGYMYHKDRIGQDMAQRMAIVHSKKYHIWSLTWKDVENCYHPQGNYYRDYISPSGLPNGSNFSVFL